MKRWVSRTSIKESHTHTAAHTEEESRQWDRMLCKAKACVIVLSPGSRHHHCLKPTAHTHVAVLGLLNNMDVSPQSCLLNEPTHPTNKSRNLCMRVSVCLLCVSQQLLYLVSLPGWCVVSFLGFCMQTTLKTCDLLHDGASLYCHHLKWQNLQINFHRLSHLPLLWVACPSLCKSFKETVMQLKRKTPNCK